MSGAVDGGLAGTGTGAVGYPVLIIDDHELFSTSLTMALRSKGFDAGVLPVAYVPGFLGGNAGPTGLVVLDLDLGHDSSGHRVDGADLVEGLRARGWKVLVVTGSLDDSRVAAAIAAGAIGSVPKSRPFEALLQTVAAAAEGQPVMTRTEHREWLERHRHHVAKEREVARRLARLSPREREVLALLAEGMRAAAIAAHFVVSMPTVRTQIRSILSKLQVGSQLEAVALLRQESAPGSRHT
ncbi:response regulator transcription factor [Pseudonocardia sp. DSM 110487]|uniref:LuxR C-terminal-related transcriptional regulator n=1 Tax=Pseudonocardia sp. DSM 110487 TaxID=2865833 RepID=UPI001C69D87C|nr:response regulator transcription factor [Pseudonocardia sp. DSM 110487]QYN34494.1 response regulator transcription factor [Pseudonocardia sp. DSM 110487]